VFQYGFVFLSWLILDYDPIMINDDKLILSTSGNRENRLTKKHPPMIC